VKGRLLGRGLKTGEKASRFALLRDTDFSDIDFRNKAFEIKDPLRPASGS
jgi:hypothetical protein